MILLLRRVKHGTLALKAESFWLSALQSCYADFPGGTVGKNPPASAGDTGSIPGLGRSHMLQSN